jgi:hypothetical protein
MRRLALALALATLAACDAASPDPGSAALLQIPGAQWRPGPLPDDRGGPAVVSVATDHPIVLIGSTGERYRGALAAGATAVVIGLDGDDGGWIVTAGLPDVATPDYPSFDVRADFADDLDPGPQTLTFIAVDRDGTSGAPSSTSITAEPEPPPDGPLVVTLAWDGAADLDLHLLDPTGAEIWTGNPNSYQPPPPGEPADPEAWKTGGLLDHDGNADCHRDGRPRERITWTVPPPAGDYVVRVDTRSLCGDAAARWTVTAHAAGAQLAAATGTSTATDTRFPHGTGAGVLATRFSVP